MKGSKFYILTLNYNGAGVGSRASFYISFSFGFLSGNNSSCFLTCLSEERLYILLDVRKQNFQASESHFKNYSLLCVSVILFLLTHTHIPYPVPYYMLFEIWEAKKLKKWGSGFGACCKYHQTFPCVHAPEKALTGIDVNLR